MSETLAEETRLDVPELVRIIGQVLGGDYSERPPLSDDDDDFGLLVLLLRFLIDDLEGVKATHEAARFTRQRIDESKHGFLRKAAHEMHTPLTPIRMQLHLLRKEADAGNLDPRHGRSIEIIQRNLTRLMVILQDLLDISHIDGGDLPLCCKPYEVSELVMGRLEEFSDMARSRNIQLAAECESGLVASIDAERIADVVDALLSNAMKFTPDGGFVIARCMRRGREVMVEIQDSGVGIEADEVDVFEPFGRGKGRGLHGDPSSGLGLYACKAMVERHGGIIWCASDGLNQGTTFRFVVPMLAGSEAVAKLAR